MLNIKRQIILMATLAIILSSCIVTQIYPTDLPQIAQAQKPLDVTLTGASKLNVNQPETYTATLNTVTLGEVSYSWSITPDDDKTILQPNGATCILTFIEATEEPYSLIVEIHDLNNNFGVASIAVTDPPTYPSYYLGTAGNQYNYLIKVDESLSWYYAINGKTGAVDFYSTNCSYIVNSVSTNGGLILFSTGTFPIHNITPSNFTIYEGISIKTMGEGSTQQTTLQLDTTGPMFSFNGVSPYSGYNRNIEFRNLRFDGNNNLGNLIHAVHTHLVTIKDCTILSFGQSPIYAEGCWEWTIDNTYFVQNGDKNDPYNTACIFLANGNNAAGQCNGWQIHQNTFDLLTAAIYSYGGNTSAIKYNSVNFITNNWFHGQTTSAARPTSYIIEGNFTETLIDSNDFVYSELGFIKFLLDSNRNTITNNQFANLKSYAVYFTGSNFNSRTQINSNYFGYHGSGETLKTPPADGLIYSTNVQVINSEGNQATITAPVVPLFNTNSGTNVFTHGYTLYNGSATWTSEGFGSTTIADGEAVSINAVATPRIFPVSRTVLVSVAVGSSSISSFTVRAWNSTSVISSDSTFIYYEWAIP